MVQKDLRSFAKRRTMKKRKPEIVVLSDLHLGTYGCHARELLGYLRSIKPRILILNGDIIDIWSFRKSYFPKSHLKVVREIMDFASKGTQVYYITGNHDEMLRKFSGMRLGNFHLEDKLLLELDGRKAWIFHGDVFDASVQHSKWIAKLGGMGYDYLILLNRMINWCLERLGKEPYSFSKKIKASVKKAVKFISDFEKTATDLALDKGYDYVICGHIHEPKITNVKGKDGSVLYLNSGDWIENKTALEYNRKRWKLYRYDDDLTFKDKPMEKENVEEIPVSFQELLLSLDIKQS